MYPFITIKFLLLLFKFELYHGKKVLSRTAGRVGGVMDGCVAGQADNNTNSAGAGLWLKL